MSPVRIQDHSNLTGNYPESPNNVSRFEIYSNVKLLPKISFDDVLSPQQRKSINTSYSKIINNNKRARIYDARISDDTSSFRSSTLRK